jgi:hypothetical protein
LNDPALVVCAYVSECLIGSNPRRSLCGEEGSMFNVWVQFAEFEGLV